MCGRGGRLRRVVMRLVIGLVTFGHAGLHQCWATGTSALWHRNAFGGGRLQVYSISILSFTSSAHADVHYSRLRDQSPSLEFSLGPAGYAGLIVMVAIPSL